MYTQYFLRRQVYSQAFVVGMLPALIKKNKHHAYIGHGHGSFFAQIL
jgi:hypothetical protein